FRRGFFKSFILETTLILPAHIIHDLEQLMRGFLWCQGELKKSKAKVAWESVYKPKLEGGLDITRSGFNLDDSVSDFISNGNWRWPHDWLDRVLSLSSILVPNLIVDCDDVRL
ncbi:hypothetical protein Tco_0107837, partial [Tanacetum coccineum]